MQIPVVLPEVTVGLLVTILGAVLVWPFKVVKREWNAAKETLAETKAELELQRTNHLTHIEEYGKTQIELLGKVADTLDGVRLDLREQTGYLAASSAPRARVRNKK
jgi:hypothetical protein